MKALHCFLIASCTITLAGCANMGQRTSSPVSSLPSAPMPPPMPLEPIAPPPLPPSSSSISVAPSRAETPKTMYNSDGDKKRSDKPKPRASAKPRRPSRSEAAAAARDSEERREATSDSSPVAEPVAPADAGPSASAASSEDAETVAIPVPKSGRKEPISSLRPKNDPARNTAKSSAGKTQVVPVSAPAAVEQPDSMRMS